MEIWKIRGGRGGAFEEKALNEGLAILQFTPVPDIARVPSQEAMRDVVQQAYPSDDDKKRLPTFTGELWSFLNEVEVGDLVVMPHKGPPFVSIGKVQGPYLYRLDLGPDGRHTRTVKWILKEERRPSWKDDLMRVLQPPQTICRIRNSSARAQVAELLAKLL